MTAKIKKPFGTSNHKFDVQLNSKMVGNVRMFYGIQLTGINADLKFSTPTILSKLMKAGFSLRKQYGCLPPMCIVTDEDGKQTVAQKNIGWLTIDFTDLTAQQLSNICHFSKVPIETKTTIFFLTPNGKKVTVDRVYGKGMTDLINLVKSSAGWKVRESFTTYLCQKQFRDFIDKLVNSD